MLRKWKISLALDFDKARPLYQQIEQAIIEEINKGRLTPDMPMPGTRELARDLKVHRKTVIQAYERLLSQGLLYAVEKQGTFVAKRPTEAEYNKKKRKASFHFRSFKADFVEELPQKQAGLIKFDDGFPDPRLGPLLELTSTYKNVFKRTLRQKQMEFQNPQFYDPMLNLYVNMLNQNKGMNIDRDRACFVHGSQMALYMVSQLLLKKDDTVAMSNPGNPFAWNIFDSVGARLVTVQTDQNGMDTDHLETILKQQKIKVLYITPLCEYPSTATLSNQRRKHLLSLSAEYGFAIIESDMDHEFWFEPEPYKPLASDPDAANVIYLSALSKMLPPFFLMGVVTGPVDFIRSLTALREMIGQQGDILLEHATEDMIRDGVMSKYARKSNNIYREKRNNVAAILQNYLHKQVSFQVPKGGLAYWLKFREPTDLTNLLTRLNQRGIYIRNPNNFSFAEQPVMNHLRIGFGSLDLRELETGIKTIADIISA